MKTRHTAVLALIAWLLLLPPTRQGNWDTKAPLSQWTKMKTFTSEQACRAGTIAAIQSYGYTSALQHASAAQRAAMANMFVGTSSYSGAEAESVRCVPADDPRLKKQ